MTPLTRVRTGRSPFLRPRASSERAGHTEPGRADGHLADGAHEGVAEPRLVRRRELEREEAVAVALVQTRRVGLRELRDEGRRRAALFEQSVEADVVALEPLDVAQRVPGRLREFLGRALEGAQRGDAVYVLHDRVEEIDIEHVGGRARHRRARLVHDARGRRRPLCVIDNLRIRLRRRRWRVAHERRWHEAGFHDELSVFLELFSISHGQSVASETSARVRNFAQL